jgi:hypothetical protein
VLCPLWEEQKEKCVSVWHDLNERLERRPELLKKIMAGDEM